VVRETAPAIEARVDRALERCFSTKARTATARPKTAKATPRVQVPAPAAAARRARAS
jgi:hypothetical protein